MNERTPTEAEAIERAEAKLTEARKLLGDARDWLYGVGGEQARRVRYLTQRLEGMTDTALDATADLCKAEGRR